MVGNIRPALVDLSRQPPPLERQVHDEFAPKPKLPEYIEADPHTPPVGKLSAAALAIEYEKTAKEIASLGTELQQIQASCERVLEDVTTIIKHVSETAAFYRQEGQKVYTRIELYAKLAEDTRRTCDELRKRIETRQPGDVA